MSFDLRTLVFEPGEVFSAPELQTLVHDSALVPSRGGQYISLDHQLRLSSRLCLIKRALPQITKPYFAAIWDTAAWLHGCAALPTLWQVGMDYQHRTTIDYSPGLRIITVRNLFAGCEDVEGVHVSSLWATFSAQIMRSEPDFQVLHRLGRALELGAKDLDECAARITEEQFRPRSIPVVRRRLGEVREQLLST